MELIVTYNEAGCVCVCAHKTISGIDSAIIG